MKRNMAAMIGNAAQLTMGTHSGTFQCDEALGIWMLRTLPKWKNAKLVRSRDPAVLDSITAEGGIVIDVGGVYDEARLRFDHHQRGFFETYDGKVGEASGPEGATGKFLTKLSACGLIYKHYAREILCELQPSLISDEARLDAVLVKVYESMVEGLDAIDNGIEIADTVRYIEGTGLSSRVGRLNPRWNAEPVDDPVARENECFERASALAGGEFAQRVDDLVHGWLPARDLVGAALAARHGVDGSGSVICFESGGMPWREHLYQLEREAGLGPVTKFVLYADQGGMWRVQAVTVEGTAFTNRLSLPEAWRGLRDAVLCKEAGMEGCCFVHAAGFIGGHKTREGALAMAKAALLS